jgi:hypothetical protein
MNVTIFYRHPQRQSEAGMSRVDEAHAAMTRLQLESRGFQIVAWCLRQIRGLRVLSPIDRRLPVVATKDQDGVGRYRWLGKYTTKKTISPIKPRQLCFTMR